MGEAGERFFLDQMGSVPTGQDQKPERTVPWKPLWFHMYYCADPHGNMVRHGYKSFPHFKQIRKQIQREQRACWRLHPLLKSYKIYTSKMRA